MQVVWLAIAATGLAMAPDVFRVGATWLAWFLFSYQFLVEAAQYLNHFIAATLVLFLLGVATLHTLGEWVTAIELSMDVFRSAAQAVLKKLSVHVSNLRWRLEPLSRFVVIETRRHLGYRLRKAADSNQARGQLDDAQNRTTPNAAGDVNDETRPHST